MILASGETATCMYNSPHEEESLPRVLPGKLLSLDAQCRKDRGTRYFRLENISLILTSQTLAAPASKMTESAPSYSASTPGRVTASPTDLRQRGRDVETTRSDLITSTQKIIFLFLTSDVSQWQVRSRARERHRLRGRVPQEDGQR